MTLNSLTIDEVVENFELLDDWDQRYAYLVELGEMLPPLDESARVDENRVHACMSKVWVYAEPDPSADGLVTYQGDCDTSIIKGVLALLIGVMSGRSNDEIQALNLDGLFDELKLAEHLSPNRHVGVYAIVDLMKVQAGHTAAQPPTIEPA